MWQTSYFIRLSKQQKLHLRHIHNQTGGPVVWMLHGAVENGRIFYTPSGKGLGPYLARCGYEVYIADLGGRGLSTPRIGADSSYSQTQTICHELPAMQAWLEDRHPHQPQFWIAHSWGGVLFFAHLARQARRVPAYLKGILCLGTKRSVQVQNLERWLYIELVWKRLAYLLTAWYGYLPAKTWKIGADNESKDSHHQSVCWVKKGPWKDPVDHFDYSAALQKCQLPPTLFVTGSQDQCLGHAADIKRFIRELSHPKAEFKLIGKNTGFLHDYDHISLLTHPEAPQDHFPYLYHWLQAQLT